MILFPIDDHSGKSPRKRAPKKSKAQPRKSIQTAAHTHQPVKPPYSPPRRQITTPAPIPTNYPSKKRWWSLPKVAAIFILIVAVLHIFVNHFSSFFEDVSLPIVQDIVDKQHYEFMVIVTSYKLNVRQSPNKNGKIIRQLSQGDVWYANSTSTEGWMEITSELGERIGFCSEKHLKIISYH